MWRSDNGGDTWVNLNNGLGTLQFQSIALHPTDNSITYGGTQDNGTQKFNGAATWNEIFSGDGGATIVDFSNPQTVFVSYVHLKIGKSLDGGANVIYPVINGIPLDSRGNVADRTGFYSPYAMDPTNSQRLAAGTYRVYYTANGAGNWTNISGDLTGGGFISALTFASNGTRIWTGSSDAQIWRGDLAGGSWNWTNVSKAPLANRYITRIAAHPTDPQTAYVSYAGFDTAHIFKTTDGGASWTNASAGIPDIPVNVVLLNPNNPNLVYAGTDIGVYRSTDQGANWTIYGESLPNSAVFDLALNRTTGVLRAATHGRGIWEIQTAGEQSFTIFNDGSAPLQVTGITKQNNAAWLSFTPPAPLPFELAPGASARVSVSVEATGLSAGQYSDRLLVTSNDTARSPYPNGVFINLTVGGGVSGCSFTITPTSQSVAAGGGSGTVNVTTLSECGWAAASNVSWIVITSGNGGTGSGAVNFMVAANPGSARSGTLIIAGKTFTVTQSGGSNCTFTTSPSSQSFAANGGTGSVNVNTTGGCNWTALSNQDWINITSGSVGAGNGAVGFTVAANISTTTRTGTLTISGQTFTVTQSANSNCTFTLNPDLADVRASGGAGSFNIATQSGCYWTAASLDDWIIVTSGASGVGNGTVNYLVAASTVSIARFGDIEVAGKELFNIRQVGTGRDCRIMPISIGDTKNEALTTSDCRSPSYGDQYYADLYSFSAPAGQQVYISLDSAQFNAYLVLIGPDGSVITEDDNGGGATNARIPPGGGFITLPLSGTYLIEASSLEANETGNYTLKLMAPAGCAFALAPTSQAFNAAGGSSSVAVTAPPECNWFATSNVNWITITAGTSGSGPGTVNYRVAANPSAATRIGTLTIAGQTFTVTQAGGSACSFSLAPTSQAFASGGGTGSVAVNSQSGCFWSAVSNELWLKVTAGASGQGNGTVSYSVDANNSGPRTGTLTIAGQTFTVTQAANPNCTFSLNPTSQSFPAASGAGSFAVSAPGGCGWAATSAASWITLPIGTGFGTGNGTVSFLVAANLDAAARTATITAGEQTFTITQQGSLSQMCPTIANINPSSGAPGTSVTITGTNFTGVTAVKFANNVAAQFTINSATLITATVPSGAVTGPLTISKPNCPDAQSATFTVTTTACPTVSGINPTSGSVGSSVTITGTNFTGVTAVRFANNVAAQFTVNSDTQITATVPNGATTGSITISKPNCPDAQAPAPFTITQPGPCIAVSLPTNLTAGTGGTLTVPINVSDTAGRGALSYDAVLTFDPAVLRLQNPPFDRASTLSAGLTVTTNSPLPGRLNISGFSSNPLNGAGVLLNLKFDVIGTLNACSDLNWTSFRFNEGTPCSTTSNGRVCTAGGSLAGAVSYCAADPPKPVPGVAINAAGSPPASATTDNAGNYQLPNLGGGPYTLTPTKTGDANGISSFDAAQIAQHVVGIITLNDCQRAAADTSNNGELTSFDAAFIAQYAVGISNPANFTGTWKFLPPTRSYSTLSGPQTAQNFNAVLLGELTGNWTPGGATFSSDVGAHLRVRPGANPGQTHRSAPTISAQQASLALPTLAAAAGSSITVPITVSDLTGKGVLAYDLDLLFDQNVLQAQNPAFDVAGTLSSALTITANATPGRLRISAFGAQALSGAGILLNLKFSVSAGGGTALSWQRCLLNETAQTALTNGRINVARAVASVSAASFIGTTLAPESIVAAFGNGLAASVGTANQVPLPTMLAGTTVRVRDSAGTEHLAPLFFVAPTQINYLIPLGTASGAASVTVTSGDGTVSLGNINIAAVAPGLFTANASGQGVAAAAALRVKADNTQSFEPVARFDATLNRFVSVPIELGPAGEQVFLLLFGTGLRGRSSLAGTTILLGGANAEVSFVGAVSGLAGLDQVNVAVPRSLAGRGEVEIVLLVEGKEANTVRINIK